MITIQELLYNRGLDKTARIKLIRHKDSRTDLYNLYRQNKNSFLTYQSQQINNVFNDVDYIVSFIGEGGTLARFIGVFRVINVTELTEEAPSIEGGNYQFYYDLEEIIGFEKLSEKVIIDWGKGTRKWNQNINNLKEVVEIQPGLDYKPFTDYFDFILDFQQLKGIVQNQYPLWKLMLSVTKGVYLISDNKTGELYVGSAYGENGIWGRWETYVSTNGHGNNKKLKKLINNENNYATNFSFSILMLLPKTITPDEAIKKEALFKKKLGTNSFGLNEN